MLGKMNVSRHSATPDKKPKTKVRSSTAHAVRQIKPRYTRLARFLAVFDTSGN